MPQRERNVQELAGAVMALVQLVNLGQARAFDVELAAVMQLLLRDGLASPSEIARQLEVPRSSVTGRVRLLRESGWVEIRPDPDDGRSYLAGLTDAGEEEMSRLIDAGLEVFRAWTWDWSDEEMETFTRLARRLTGQAVPPPVGTHSRRDPWWRQDDSGPAES
ncbi:MAG: MarR family winged helix-turn-helix transcriptional regulator [Trebonia sp.]